MAGIRYTVGLIRAGIERRRLTAQLIDMATQVADTIAQNVRQGARTTVADKTYSVRAYKTNLGVARYLTVTDTDTQGEYYTRVFTNRKADEEFYVHNDFRCPLQNASRDQWLHLVNNLPSVTDGFKAEEETVTAVLREAFASLRRLAGE